MPILFLCVSDKCIANGTPKAVVSSQAWQRQGAVLQISFNAVYCTWFLSQRLRRTPTVTVLSSRSGLDVSMLYRSRLNPGQKQVEKRQTSKHKDIRT